jgi:simple sugar transport system permease protein
VLAVLTGLIIGAIVIIVTDAVVVAAFGKFFQAPGAALAAAWNSIASSYGALFRGSFGSLGEITSALASGNPAAVRQASGPSPEPWHRPLYLHTSLSRFRGGLFNIGAEGQF